MKNWTAALKTIRPVPSLRHPALWSLAALFVPMLTSPAAEQAQAAGSVSFKKPAWLTDLSLAAKEGYDNNLYLVSGDGAAEKASWITTISPKIGVNFAPLIKGQKTLQVLSLGYAPDFAIYHDQCSESYNAHRFAGTVKGKADAFSFALDNGLNYIDGKDTGPVYTAPDDARSAYATAVPRERRQQIQDRAKVVLQYDWKKCFLRSTASLLYYDLQTGLRSTAGYQNYADRYDFNGGLDAGYKLTPQLAATLGYRFGHQYQQQYPNQIDAAHLSSTSDYQRLLAGIEGKPWKWLTVALQGGPDFRNYLANSTTHTTPVNNPRMTTYYGEASITADITASDSLSFKYKQWQWVSSTGKIPYFDSTYDLNYRRKVTKQLTLDLGAKACESDYTSANIASGLRDDLQYSLSVGATYAFNPHWSATLTYNADFGRNAQDKINNANFREFDHDLISLGVLYKF